MFVLVVKIKNKQKNQKKDKKQQKILTTISYSVILIA